MRQSLRPYVTAGVAVLGAGMVAVTPMAAASSVAIQPMPEVALTAEVDFGSIDFTQAWTDAFDTAKSNFDVVQAATSDASSALSDALKAADFETLDFKQLSAALTFLEGDQKNFLVPVSNNTLDALHNVIFNVLTNPDADPPMLPADILPIVNFVASPLSGELFAALSPSLSPLAALMNSFDAISANLSDADGATPDLTAALQEMVNIPANMFNAMLNGATLDLDALVPVIADAGLLPEGIEIDHLSLALGGLLSPGGVNTGVVVGEGDDAVHVGGSILNALGLGVNLGGAALPIEGVGLGPLGAFAMVENIVTQWLSGELPPLVPADTDVDPGGGAAGDVDLSSLLDGLGLGDWL